MKELQIGVKGIIFDKDKFILIKRSSVYGKKLEDTWDFPGGRIHLGEEPEKGLEREVKEEIGTIDFNIEKPVHVVSVVNDQERQIVRITYKCKFLRGKFKLSEEHVDYDWFQTSKLPNNLDKFAARAIKSLGT